MNKCYELIKLNPMATCNPGSTRRGNLVCNLARVERLFGPSHTQGQTNQMSAEWFFETPRGRVTIRDWWSAPTDQLTIAASTDKAARWLVSYLTFLGSKASMGIDYDRQ